MTYLRNRVALPLMNLKRPDDYRDFMTKTEKGKAIFAQSATTD